MRVVLSVWGRFQMFHLARQLERFNCLEGVFSTYPRVLLKRENIAPGKLYVNPWLHAPLLVKWRAGIYNDRLDRLWLRVMDDNQTRFIARHMPQCDVFIGHSGSGARAGPLVQQRGGTWICDRSSSHQLHADRLLTEEYARFGAVFTTAEPWALDKELYEYEKADRIVVPSEYARRSFLTMGVDPSKVVKISFGGDLSASRRTCKPNPDTFTVFFCGQISFRKGIPYLLEAFHRVKHPRKKLVLAGSPLPEIKPYLATAKLDQVEFVGNINREQLNRLYSRAHVFALASVDEGMALVQAEAMACSTPVVGTENSGAADIVRDGVDGYVVEIRNPDMLAERLQRFADNPRLSAELGANALERIRSLGGWDRYGETYHALLTSLVVQRLARN